MSKILSDKELEEQVRAVTQTMLIALSEWQAGAPVDYHTAKKEGRSKLVTLIKTQRQNTVVAGKKIEFVHTAVNRNMHLFIDGDHDPKICPECIQPGILVESEARE